MNIVGLGKAGCAIADKFSQHPQYKIYKVDEGPENDFDFIENYGTTQERIKVLNIKKQDGPEQYESNCPPLKSFFGKINGPTVLVMGGSGDITAISLRIIEQIKPSCDVHVLYIRPDIELLSEIKKMHEKVTYNVLQEYARSGQLAGVCLISNPELESTLDNISIIGYYDKLNELLVSTLHMISVYKNSDSIMGGLSDAGATKRVYTVGIFDIEKNEEKLFFPLDNIREKGYIYSISKEKLETESGLHKLITSQMKEKLSDENVSVSFGVFPNDYKMDYGYVLAYSPKIQS